MLRPSFINRSILNNYFLKPFSPRTGPSGCFAGFKKRNEKMHLFGWKFTLVSLGQPYSGFIENVF